MTPNRREKIGAMLHALDMSCTAGCFRACGGTIILAPQTNTARFAGVQSTCTWSKDVQLVAGWVKAARRKLEAAALDASLTGTAVGR